MKRLSSSLTPSVPTLTPTSHSSTAGSPSLQRTAQDTHESVTQRAVELVSSLRRFSTVRDKHRRLAGQVSTRPPENIPPHQQIGDCDDVKRLKASLDKARLLPPVPTSGSSATARRTDQAYCEAVLWAREASLKAIPLPLTCAALLDPSKSALEQARLEVLWQIGMHPTTPCCIDLLVQLLQMNRDVGLLLPAGAIPPGEPGQRMVHALTEAFSRCGEQRPPFAVEGTLPPYVKPKHLPRSTARPWPPAKEPGHSPDLKHAVELARSLASAVQDHQQEHLAPRERLHTQNLKLRTATTELATRAGLLDAALSESELLASLMGDDDGRLTPGWAALLLHRLVWGSGLALPDTQTALEQHPPSPALLDDARREVLGLLVNGCDEPGLSTLLNCLLRLDPDTPMRLGHDNLPDGEDVGMEEALAVLLPAWPTQGAPWLDLHTAESVDDRSSDAAPPLGMQALFVQPGLERLCLRDFRMSSEQMNRTAAQVRQQGSSLKALVWQDGEVCQTHCGGFASLVEALPRLEELSLFIVPDLDNEDSSPEDTPVHEHPLPAGLSKVLAAKPLQRLAIEFFGDSLNPPMAILLAPLVEAMRSQPQGMAWTSVSLIGVCDSTADHAVIEGWLSRLVASPAVQTIDLNVSLISRYSSHGQAGLDADELRPALKHRQQPLELQLHSDMKQFDYGFPLELFMDTAHAEATGSVDVPEPVLAPCIHAVALHFDWDCPPPRMSALLGELTRATTRMPHVKQLVLKTTARQSTGIDYWPERELQVFTETWRTQPHIELAITGNNPYAEEWRRQLGQVLQTRFARIANGYGLQALLSHRSESWLPLELYEEIGGLAAKPTAEHAGDTLPILNRTQLLATVTAYNDLVRENNNASQRPEARVKVTRPHPMASAAQLVGQHQKEEANEAARHDRATLLRRRGL